MKSKYSIFGSCCSRDIFNFSNIENNSAIIKTYIARNSIYSMFGEKYDYQVDKIELDSLFQKSMVKFDLEKKVIEQFRKIPSDYLIIDFIDTVRFNLFKIGDSLLTGSVELQESGLLNDKIDIRVLKPGEIPFDEKEIIIKKLFSELLDIFSHSKVILHCCYFKNNYLDKNGDIKMFEKNIILRNKELNEHLEYLHLTVKKMFPQIVLLDINNRDIYKADINHIWGLGPMHYSQNYYIDALNFLINNENIT